MSNATSPRSTRAPRRRAACCSTRAGRIVSVSQQEHRADLPPARLGRARPGARSGRNVQYGRRRTRSTKAQLSPRDIVAIGITNQRETTVLWDRATGEPVHNAINWQDTRTDQLVARAGRRRRAGPLPRPLRAAARHVLLGAEDPLAARQRRRAARRAPRPATCCSARWTRWLIWNLTGRHITDVTNASRTMLMNLETLDWDDELLDAIGVPRAMLPEIRPSAEVYGEADGALAGVPVAGALGDQHAALFGQTCFALGEAKCTYGTGSFLLLNTGDEPVRSANGLLTTVGYKIGDEPADVRARGLDRGHRRARAVVPRQPRADRLGARDRDAGAHGRGQRRLLLRARVLRPVRAALAQRRARRDRRPDRLHHQGPPRPRGARGDRVADARGRRRDEQPTPASTSVDAEGRRRHDRQQPADAVPRRRARRAGGAPDRGRDACRSARRTRPAWRSASGPTSRRCAPTGTAPPSGCRRWIPRSASKGYRKWRKAVARTLDWVDEDDDDETS